jgi:hypothetical protein
MFRKWGFGILAVCVVWPLKAKSETSGFRIKYISTENVYLDGGTYDGLRTGDTLAVKKSGQRDVLIKIVYISESSSACQIIVPGSPIARGDFAVPLTVRALLPDLRTATASRNARRERAIAPQPVGPVKRFKTRVSGTASVQWYQVKDLSAYGYNLEQPGARMTLMIRNLWTEGFHFDFRIRSRQTIRSYKLAMPERSAWNSRLYTLLFSYEPPQSVWRWQAGRIVSNEVSGLGVIDGFMVERRLWKRMSLGWLGGAQPKWYYGGFQPSYRKSGLFVTMRLGESVPRRLESTLAFAGTYHGPMISREFVYVQNQVNAKRWNLYQSAELELNRQWRYERTRERVTLSSLYAFLEIRAAAWVTAGFSYDNRRQVLTYEQRSLADSLFDEALRKGIRGRFKLQLPWRTSCFLDAGVRDGFGRKEKSVSWSGGLSKQNLLWKSLSGNAYWTSFANDLITGRYQSLQATQTIHGIHSVSAGFNRSEYTIKSTGIGNRTDRLQFDLYLQLPYRFFLSEQFEYAWGADAPGYHVIAEWGYRF